MIQELVTKWEEKKHILESKYSKQFPENYTAIVKDIAEILDLNPNEVHEICEGSYSGTLLYIIYKEYYIRAGCYYVLIDYGSCSACDTLEAIRPYDSSLIDQTTINDLMILALHIVQGLKEMEVKYLLEYEE